ncbi:hypothetical protein RHMOL_Rhmol01G0196000 [Rhododendron molle]|uniref:Uncharacterized protein n=1 Tax=Rhododendron molle TaxID=49168 RepID=A0ACC0Q4N9_RHOML|nr:hypothetical protein RHMOL_Rhmol01G0196000 [Rhododendron molle]
MVGFRFCVVATAQRRKRGFNSGRGSIASTKFVPISSCSHRRKKGSRRHSRSGGAASAHRVAAKARLRNIFDPNYEPWEEVHDALDQSDSEDVEVDNSFHGGCFGIGAHYHRFQVGESSRSNTIMEAGDALVAYTL